MAGTERDDTELRAEAALAQSTGARGPAGFWRLGLVALLAVIVVLFVLQWAGGNRQTAVQPGTPVAAPQPEAPASR